MTTRSPRNMEKDGIDYFFVSKEKFEEIYGISDPKKMIDLKALMGDSSDNIPGVKGVGEKTAISLIQKYGNLDGVYNNLDTISTKTREKLVNDKENAYMSYDIATIYKEVPIDVNLDNIKYLGTNIIEYEKILNELEFYSLLKKLNIKKIEEKNENLEYKIIDNLDKLNLSEPYAIYLETLGYNYHTDLPLGVSIKDKDSSYYIPFELLKNTNIFNDNKKKYTYDLKKLIYVFNKYNIKIDKNIDDLMLICYLLNKNIKTDIAYLANSYQYEIKFYEKIYGSEITYKYPSDDTYIKEIVLKSLFIYEKYNDFYNELLLYDAKDLYHELELPLTYVLAKMEANGFLVDVSFMNEMDKKLDDYLKELENICTCRLYF